MPSSGLFTARLCQLRVVGVAVALASAFFFVADSDRFDHYAAHREVVVESGVELRDLSIRR
jgi:hypothetical protein